MKSLEILEKLEGLQEITKELEQYGSISAENFSFSLLSAELKNLQVKLQQEKFYLVMIGLFKRGKSSLVNAIIGKEIVPYSVVPLTSIVTLIEYGETDYAEIYFIDGKKKVCEIKNIYEYVTEMENPLNKKNVDYVKVYVNSDFLKKITLVDTPGIGSTFENNTETTYSFINKIDAALFILSADLPISKTEVEFLTKLKTTVPKIVFVLNKIDLITEKELENMLIFNSNTLKNLIGSNTVDIIPVSARYALEGIQKNDFLLYRKSGFERLVEEIEKILAKEKHNVILASAKNQYVSFIEKIETILNMQLKILLTPIEKLNNDYKEFLNSMQIMKKEKGDFEILINGKIKQLQEYVTETLYGLANNLIKRFYAELDKNAQKLFNSLDIGGIEQVHQNYLKEIEYIYSSVKAKLEKEVVERFQNILTEYSQGSNKFLNELVKNFSSNSLFDFQELISSFDLNIQTSFYFKFDKNYNPFYLSKKIYRKIAYELFRKKIIRKVKEDLHRNIDMNIGRINYDINYKIQESFRKFNSLLNEKLDETLKMLDNFISETINRKEKTEDVVSEQVKFINEQLFKLSTLKFTIRN